MTHFVSFTASRPKCNAYITQTSPEGTEIGKTASASSHGGEQQRVDDKLLEHGNASIREMMLLGILLHRRTAEWQRSVHSLCGNGQRSRKDDSGGKEEVVVEKRDMFEERFELLLTGFLGTAGLVRGCFCAPCDRYRQTE